ncbi:MAG TPA: hypothetical protein VFD09_11625 [Thiopseudomonas sp.]|nr:hypothetical protein [Thiopseudomonas sp.]
MTEKKKHPTTHEPTTKTRAEVSALCSYGVPQDEVASFIGIDPKTLRKYYRDELDKAALTANAKVGQFLYQNASGQTLGSGATHSDCVRAAMFWAKTRMNWRETQNVDVTSNGETMKGRSLDEFYADVPVKPES